MKNPIEKIEKPEVRLQMNREGLVLVGLFSLTIYFWRKANQELKKR